jgi:hypothetical protein
MSKRWGKGPGVDPKEIPDELLEEMIGTMLPVSCSGDDCEKRTHLMLPGDSPYEAGVFTGKGWTAVVAENPPAISFLCAECFQREVAQNHVGTKPRVSIESQVSG